MANPCFRDLSPALTDDPNDPNAPNISGDTPIYIAAGKGYLYLVQILAALTDNPNAPNSYGETPIYAAAIKGYVDIVKVLANLTDNPNAPDQDGQTPIQAALRHGYESDSWTILELVQILTPLEKDHLSNLNSE